jgi:RNA polymerase sigma-70 factor (ECF subfamily)
MDTKINTNSTILDPSTLVDQHADYLFRFAMQRVRDKSLAEDLVQETFLAALENSCGYAGNSSARTWLTGILKHKILDHYRRSVRFVTNEADTTEDEFFDTYGKWRIEAAPSAWNRTPEDLLEDRELGELLNNCISRLPTQLAAVFSLREIEGLSSPEICDLLSLTPSNYWVMLHRARLLMRKEFDRTVFPAQGASRQVMDATAI